MLILKSPAYSEPKSLFFGKIAYGTILADDKRLIEDYLPIEAIRKEAGQYCDIPAEAVDRASGGFGS